MLGTTPGDQRHASGRNPARGQCQTPGLTGGTESGRRSSLKAEPQGITQGRLLFGGVRGGGDSWGRDYEWVAPRDARTLAITNCPRKQIGVLRNSSAPLVGEGGGLEFQRYPSLSNDSTCPPTTVHETLALAHVTRGRGQAGSPARRHRRVLLLIYLARSFALATFFLCVVPCSSQPSLGSSSQWMTRQKPHRGDTREAVGRNIMQEKF